MSDRDRSRSREGGDDAPRQKYAGGPRSDLKSTIYVGNLPEGTQPDDIKNLFADEGYPCQDVSIPFDRAMQRSKPFGFVKLEKEDDVEECVRKMSGLELRGRNIRVEKRDPNPDPDRSWRPGPRDGGGRRGRSGGRGRGGRHDSRDRYRGGGGRRGGRDSRRRGGGRRDSRSRGGRR